MKSPFWKTLAGLLGNAVQLNLFPLRETCVFFSVPLLLLLLASILHSKCVQHVSNGKSVNACVWRIWNGPWNQALLWSGAIADWQPMLNINQKSAFTAVNHCDLGVLCSSSIAELRNTEVLEPFLLANLLKKNNNCTLGIMGKKLHAFYIFYSMCLDGCLYMWSHLHSQDMSVPNSPKNSLCLQHILLSVPYLWLPLVCFLSHWLFTFLLFFT